MKKFLIILLIIIIVSLIGGIYLLVQFQESKRYEDVFDISEPTSFPSDIINDNINVKSYSFFETPPSITFNTSFSDFTINSISTTWEYIANSNIWYPPLKEKTTNEGTNIIYNSEEIIFINSDYEPDLINVSIYSNNELVHFSESYDNYIPIMKVQGDYTYIIDIIWNEENNPYKGKYTYEFNLFVDLPIYFEFDKLTISQGDFIKVGVYNVNDEQQPFLNQTLFSKFKFFKQDYTYTGYIPASYYKNAGTYNIEYGIEGETLLTKEIVVNAYDFNIQYLYIDETLAAATKNEQSSAQYAKYFVPVRQQSSEQLYYTDSFVIPAYGRLSTEFGENRYVNGTPTSYHHSGLDIGAPLLSPIYATNRGKVVLAMNLIMTGYTIVIDHGQGLFSVYFHMDSLLVDIDEIVEREQLIGLMGTTGFSTGSHLHFTMSYFDTNIEPGYLLVGEPITRLNYAEYLIKNNE